jgi:hypothetical protein
LAETEEEAAALMMTEGRLRELVRGVREIKMCGMEHGNITYFNTVFYQDNQDGDLKLALNGFGSRVLNNDGDARSLRMLLIWCADHSIALMNDDGARARLVAAAMELENDEDFDAAMACLS